MSIVYKYHDNLYINLTNRCTAACVFCIKNKWKRRFRGNDLRLAREPSVKEVLKAVGDPKRYKETVFCGYGEPLVRLEELKAIAARIKKKGGFVRVNTSGHANLLYRRDIVPELDGLVDAISVSLNATNARQYVRLHKPAFGPASFDAVLDFVRRCRKHIPDVTVTCITMPGIDMKKCRAIAKKLRVKFRERPYLDDYENA